MSDSAGTDTGLAFPDRGPDRDAGADSASPASSRRATKERRPGVLRRVVLFYKQVVAELRKVIWPTRRELITYTSVVLVFVLFMVAIVSIYDFAFSQGVLKVFGN